MVLVAHCNSAEVVEPGEQPLDPVATFVAPQGPTILRLPPIAPIRGYHLDSVLLPKLLIQSVAVVSLIANQPLRLSVEKSRLKSILDKSYFVPRSTLDTYGDRKTRAVCDCHDLGPLAPLGFADTEPPFLAGAKVPSMKASVRSIPPRRSKSSAKARKMFSMTPWLLQSWNRRWQVWYGGYLSGRYFQGAPVRRIQRIPSRTSRESRQGRPRPSLRRGGTGINGSNSFHCSSVRSMEAMIHIQDTLVHTQMAKSGHPSFQGVTHL